MHIIHFGADWTQQKLDIVKADSSDPRKVLFGVAARLKTDRARVWCRFLWFSAS